MAQQPVTPSFPETFGVLMTYPTVGFRPDFFPAKNQELAQVRYDLMISENPVAAENGTIHLVKIVPVEAA